MKKNKPQKPAMIRSDPATVNRLLADMDRRREDAEWEREYQRSRDGGLRSHSRYHTAGADNAAHPYQGGLPELGKRR